MKECIKGALIFCSTLATILIFNSCTTEEIEQDSFENNTETELNILEQEGELIEVEFQGNLVMAEKIDDNTAILGDVLINIPTTTPFVAPIPESITTDPEIQILEAPVIANATGLASDGRWPNNTVYYVVDSAINGTTEARIFEAIDHWKARSTINLVRRNNQANYITFMNGGCASHIGMQGGQQDVYVGSCTSTGSIIHEIGHVLGLQHEQNRSDRDDYINIHYENIIDSAEGNFEIGGNDFANFTAFDFDSIMIYSSNTFAFGNGMTKKDGSTWVGQRIGLSVLDALTIARMYPSSTKNRIAIKGNNSNCVTSLNGQRAMLCDRSNILAWEKFELHHLDNGKVALEGNNAKYVSSLNGNASGIICNRTTRAAWEEFELVMFEDNMFALKGNNNRYVTSTNGEGVMTCDRTAIRDWETFEMIAQ